MGNTEISNAIKSFPEYKVLKQMENISRATVALVCRYFYLSIRQSTCAEKFKQKQEKGMSP